MQNLFVFLAVFASLATACGGSKHGNSSTKSESSFEEHTSQVSEPTASANGDVSAVSSSGGDPSAGDADAAARRWCRYGPGLLGGIQHKGTYTARQECLDARTFRDYCDPC